MNYTNKERAEYNQHRENTCQDLDISKNQYNYLRRLANQLTKIDEDSCNGVGTEEELNNKEDMLLDTVKDYLKHITDRVLYVYHQSDPRGASLYISDKPLTESNYSQAIAIY